MSQQQHVADHYSFRTAFFGMMVLTLGMGIGRFLYTPMLPVMLAEGGFTFSELSWIASINYAGYLVGSLLFSFGFLHLPTRLRPMLMSSAVVTGLLILAMAYLSQPAIVMLVRFVAGVASAGMLIFGSTLILQHTRNPFVVASLFSGVGVGIALGNEYVIAGLHLALSSQTLWSWAAVFSGAIAILLALLLPSRDHVLPPVTFAKAEHQPMRWWMLAILYGLTGFGYIIVATYLPLMAKGAGSPLLTVHLWTLVGVSVVPGCFAWLWAAKRWGVLQCLTANLLVQGACVLLTLASGSPLLLVLSSIGFGATFMGTVSLVMTLARQLSVPGNLNLLGFVTLTYGIGQILGPLLTTLLGSGAQALIRSTICGALALFLAATISALQLYKQKRFSSCRAG